MGEFFVLGFSQILNPLCLLMIFAGVFLGIVFGVVPGLTGSMAVALCLPLTYKLGAIPAIVLIMGIYIGGCSGGLISAILLNIPGTPSNIATAYDGAPMARRGEAGKALGVGIFYSFLGGTFSFIILFIVATPIARFALRFGPVEYFSIALFSLTMIAGLSGKSILKGLAAGLMGVSLSFIGMSEVDGTARMTMGIRELNAGLKLLPAIIGLYAVSELIKASKTIKAEENTKNYKIKGFGFSWKEFKEQFVNFIRSACIGTGIGILPGIGGITSNIMAYSVAKSSSKHPEKFGTGIIDGIVAPETSNNAAVGGALIPLLTLGIPGDGFTAIVLGALMVHGLTPGPLLMTNNADFIYAIFASLLVANLFTIIMEYFGIRLFVKVLNVPKHILMPIILVLSVVGAIGLNNRVFDAWTVLLFGLIGFLMSKLDFPLTPIILGFILGPLAETNLRRALMLTRGSIVPFFTRPVSLIFIILAVVSIFLAPKLIAKNSRIPSPTTSSEKE
jgi:putative tricarboxylic transport membrane protein